MVIDLDLSALPKGTIGWTRLLAAVESAHPNDESEWIEFKANLDPRSKEGRFALAKAIVAFANRDVATAGKWLGGHAVVIVGLEPGNLVGAPEVDPADLHNNINQLLAQPAPAWDPTTVNYSGKHVLIITVDPPCQGDPIACIGKNSGDAIDGHVYVRKQGKSERATSADLRRLSKRLAPGERTISGIEVAATTGVVVPVVAYTNGWLDDWIEAERHRLLAPLSPPPTQKVGAAELRARGVDQRLLADVAAKTKMAADAMSKSGMFRHHDETRSEEEFRAEVDAYLDTCRLGLEEALDDLLSGVAVEVRFNVVNHTAQNFEQVLVELHVEGDVYGYEDDAEFEGLNEHLPAPPRGWGPWTENRLVPGFSAPILPSLHFPTSAISDALPGPTIQNGGSVRVTCVPCHLYPEGTTELVSLRLVARAPVGESISITWKASARNVNGQITGSLEVEADAPPVDIQDYLLHRSPGEE